LRQEFITKKAGHGLEHTRTLTMANYSGIVCVSGDGLLNEVVNGIFRRDDCRDFISDITLGIIPAGSGNGLAASLNAPNPLTSIYGIISGRSTTMDIFTILQGDSRKYGFLSISWATMSVIDLESEGYRWLGPLRFDIKGAVEIANCYAYKGRISYIPAEEMYPSQEQIVNIDFNGQPTLEYISTNSMVINNMEWQVLEGEWVFFCACSTPKVLISPGALAKRAVINDGCIDLIFCDALSRLDLVLLLSGIEDGKAADLPFVKYVKAKAFKLEPDNSHRLAPIAIDGEPSNNEAVQVEVHKALCKIYYDWDGKTSE